MIGGAAGTEMLGPRSAGRAREGEAARILMLLKTTGLIYDDRVRKEALSLQREGYAVEILVVETRNRESTGVTDYGVPFRSLCLRTRGWSARGRGLVVKTSEMYGRMGADVARRRPDVVWLHNLEMAGLVPVMAALRQAGVIRKLVWDHHELPSDGVLRSAARRRGLGALMRACDALVMASRHREVLWRRLLPGPLPEVTVLDNLPDEELVLEPSLPLPDAVQGWLDGREFLLAQGGTSPRRHFDVLCASALELRIPILAVGPVADGQRTALVERFGPELEQWVYFTGMVPQIRLVDYIDAAAASVVLYKDTSLNSRYCAPNRMYQALGRGTPVIVGSNPGMRSVLSATAAGVALRTDGRSKMDVQDGVRQFFAQRGLYTQRAAASRNRFRWESQPLPALELGQRVAG